MLVIQYYLYYYTKLSLLTKNNTLSVKLYKIRPMLCILVTQVQRTKLCRLSTHL